MPSFDLTPTPHEEAIALIRNKPIVTRDVFNKLLPEFRGRVFTIAGVEGERHSARPWQLRGNCAAPILSAGANSRPRWKN